VWEATIDWETCSAAVNAECATIQAPLDWQDPDGELIQIALARIPALDPDSRIGSLLINPGGPGGSGIGFLSAASTLISKQVRERYDIVGFDPRGVGDSSAVVCYTDTQGLDEFFSVTWPMTPEGFEQSTAVAESFAQACDENTGRLLGYIDTESSAKDMDLIRHLLGDQKLNLLGYSYGSFLGATYAELFPDHVGRLVLDGAVDPSASAAQHEVEQAAGFEAALGAYLDDCLAGSSCPFTGTKQQAKDEIHQFLVDVGTQPLAASMYPDRILTQRLALNGIIVAMYEEAYWPYESAALGSALRDGDGSALMQLSDAYLDRGNVGYLSNQMEAFIAINCLDSRLAADLASAEEHAQALKEASPTIGEFWAYTEKQCAVWPHPQVGEPHAVSAVGAGPILVIGTTGDPATPYKWAVELTEQLESATLLTYDGDGHTAYGRSNSCISDAVDAYLLDGTVPAEGLVC
jgi:pimeloyl-ACP methyl ester carboxylesterase